MFLFNRKLFFDRNFLLDDDNLLFKNMISFNYKNIYNDNYVVQGFTISKDYCLISAYNKFKAKSRVYLYEKNGLFKKYVDLDNSSHVGGISYDYLNNIVYITGSFGKINAYDYFELISGNIIKYKCNIDISKLVNSAISAATLYFYDNKLYVCTFSDVGKMFVFSLKISNNEVKVLDSNVFDNLPASIQGICVFKQNEMLYYLFSQSYGRINSCIKLYDYNLSFLGQISLKNIGVEGIDIDYSGNICAVFENGVDYVQKVHVSKLVYKINYFLEKKFYIKAKKLKKN